MKDYRGCVEQVRFSIRYWVQDTIESGHWELTWLLSRENAQKLIDGNIFEDAKIMEDEYFI